MYRVEAFVSFCSCVFVVVVVAAAVVVVQLLKSPLLAFPL